MEEELFSIVESKPEHKKININISDYKSFIYTGLFYTFGLFVGSYLYKISNNDTINELLKLKEESIITLFTQNFCIYFSIFLIIVFLGFCIIGYPFINIIPTVIGISTGIKIAYLYLNYSAKGIGYSILMVVPYAALFFTVVAFGIEASTNLSKQLMNITKNESNGFDLRDYIKKYIILAVCIVISAILNALLNNLLYSVVTI